MVDKKTVIETLERWITSSLTTEQLDVCSVAVHDLLWTRFADDIAATELRYQISLKRALIISK
jgi:hypothetical protein